MSCDQNPTQRPLTLMRLTKGVYDHCGLFYGKGDDDLEKRKVADFTTAVAVEYLGTRQPFPNHHEQVLYRRHVRANLHHKRREEQRSQNEQKLCKFAFLVLLLEAVFSWLVERALDYTWQQYKSEHAAGQSGAFIGFASTGFVKNAVECGFCVASSEIPGSEEFDDF